MNHVNGSQNQNDKFTNQNELVWPLQLATGQNIDIWLILFCDCEQIIILSQIFNESFETTLNDLFTRLNQFTSSHLHIINWEKVMRIWRAVREGPELGPPSAPPCAGVGTGWSWGVGVVEICWMTRDDEGKTALIIYRGSLSYWLDRCVITDDELAVLIICSCSSRN